jgi:hypothetical protein
MAGKWKVRVHRVAPYSIHGDSYYEFAVERVDVPGEFLALRASAHVLPAVPQTPFLAEVGFLMSQVVEVRVVP